MREKCCIPARLGLRLKLRLRVASREYLPRPQPRNPESRRVDAPESRWVEGGEEGLGGVGCWDSYLWALTTRRIGGNRGDRESGDAETPLSWLSKALALHLCFPNSPNSPPPLKGGEEEKGEREAEGEWDRWDRESSDDSTWTPGFWGAKLVGVDDDAAKRLAEALEAAASPKPKSPERRNYDTPEVRHRLFGDPESPFRRAQEAKRTYLAREDGRRDPRG